MRHDPHTLVEGCLIAGYAMGAHVVMDASDARDVADAIDTMIPFHFVSSLTMT